MTAKMTEQELGEKIEGELSQYSGAILAMRFIATVEKVHDLKIETAKNILALIKVAGWIDPSTCIMPDEFRTPKAEEILREI